MMGKCIFCELRKFVFVSAFLLSRVRTRENHMIITSHDPIMSCDIQKSCDHFLPSICCRSRPTLLHVASSLLYKAILSVCMYVRGMFAPTGHSFQDTDIWLILVDPKC